MVTAGRDTRAAPPGRVSRRIGPSQARRRLCYQPPEDRGRDLVALSHCGLTQAVGAAATVTAAGISGVDAAAW